MSNPVGWLNARQQGDIMSAGRSPASTVRVNLSDAIGSPIFLSSSSLSPGSVSRSLVAASADGSPPSGLQVIARKLDFSTPTQVQLVGPAYGNGTGMRRVGHRAAARWAALSPSVSGRFGDRGEGYRALAALGPSHGAGPSTAAALGGAALAAGLAYGLSRLLKKRDSDKKPARTNGDKKVPIVSRKPISKFAGKSGYKKGGVIKKRSVKKTVRKR